MPRRGFCAGEPQNPVRSSVTTPHTSARKSMANQPNPGLSRKDIICDHLFASSKAILHFWGPRGLGMQKSMELEPERQFPGVKSRSVILSRPGNFPRSQAKK